MPNITRQIKAATPADGTKVDYFHYVQAGGAGDIAVRLQAGDVVVISSALLSKMGIVPVGQMDEILATGTTATNIYYW